MAPREAPAQARMAPGQSVPMNGNESRQQQAPPQNEDLLPASLEYPDEGELCV